MGMIPNGYITVPADPGGTEQSLAWGPSIYKHALGVYFSPVVVFVLAFSRGTVDPPPGPVPSLVGLFS